MAFSASADWRGNLICWSSLEEGQLVARRHESVLADAARSGSVVEDSALDVVLGCIENVSDRQCWWWRRREYPGAGFDDEFADASGGTPLDMQCPVVCSSRDGATALDTCRIGTGVCVHEAALAAGGAES